LREGSRRASKEKKGKLFFHWEKRGPFHGWKALLYKGKVSRKRQGGGGKIKKKKKKDYLTIAKPLCEGEKKKKPCEKKKST